MSEQFRKDASLDVLANEVNVAQFVSFTPVGSDLAGYSRVLGFLPNHRFATVGEGVTQLLASSPEGTVNVRSFSANSMRSNEFLYGLTSVGAVVEAVDRITRSGHFAIVNETIDVHDGGVSGVVQRGVVEFSPDDTPRCVEKPGVASLPLELATRVLEAIYGFPVALGQFPEHRLEFSIHPRPRGWKQSHLLGWELEPDVTDSVEARVRWPNNFSRMIGDKAFGLLVASELGLPVPFTTVISRRLAPFTFGSQTGSFEWWLRTCPREQVAGRFTTTHGWTDPYQLLSEEDPSGTAISSVLAQRAVPAAFSGAAIVDAEGTLIVEGKRGEGEALMRGEARREVLPQNVLSDVEELFQKGKAKLGTIRFEWVHDGTSPWFVQLHVGSTESTAKVLVPGDALVWREFLVSRGLEALRHELASLGMSEGIRLVGDVGLTSHVADVVRKAGRPARVA